MTLDVRAGTETVARIAAGLVLASGGSICLGAPDVPRGSESVSIAGAPDHVDTGVQEAPRAVPRALEPRRTPTDPGIAVGVPANPGDLNDAVTLCAAGRSLEWWERCGIA